MGRTKKRREPLARIWQIPYGCGSRRKRSPKVLALEGHRPTGGARSRGSSWAYSAAVSGTNCPGATSPRTVSTVGSSGGPPGKSWRRSEPYWSSSVTNSAGSSRNGRRPTGCWARPGSGGEKGGKNPTDRGKKGTTKHLVTNGQGDPLVAVISDANVPDCKLLEATINAIVIERPEPEEVEQHMSLDAGFNNALIYDFTVILLFSHSLY